jgi:hypothetical protein
MTSYYEAKSITMTIFLKRITRRLPGDFVHANKMIGNSLVTTLTNLIEILNKYL